MKYISDGPYPTRCDT